MKIINFIALAVFNLFFVSSIPVNDNNTRNNEEWNDYEIKHRNILENYLSECTVLLRKNGDFPLNENDKQVYLYGNGIRNTVKGGTGSGEVNSRSFDTIEEAFIKEGFEILSKDFLDEYDRVYAKAREEFNKKLQFDAIFHPITSIMGNLGVIMSEPEYTIKFPETGDIAIYVLSRISGEGTDRKFVKGDVLLTDTEKKNILTMARGYKKFMLVLNTGGPVDLSGLEEVENILILSQLGVSTSKALVDIISGKKYPSGKLTTTWSKQEDYPTIGDFGEVSDTNYKEGIFVGYRYFDTLDVDVMFPFGFGLSYTDFNFNIESSYLNGDEFTINTFVSNTGKFNGKEVLQLYLSKPNTNLDEPYQILVNFAKSKELMPNESQILSLSFKLSEFASYDTESASYILDEGEYIVRVGNSSRNTKPCAVITVPSRVMVKQLQNKMGNPGFTDASFKSMKKDDLMNVQKYILNVNSIKSETENYDKVFEINEQVKNLSKEDKAKLVVGAFNPDGGIASVVGSAASSVAGAAGETAKVANLKPIIMSDGPAGIRIAKDYYEDKDGYHSTEGSIPSSMLDTLPSYIKWILDLMTPKVPKDAVILHQYTTAIPIGTAIAQSWNREFAEICGDIVGTEMEIFNINLWLAPALNIHRSILCGRNYEYFSEDPLISGYFAASITKGVQKHKNAFVSIKHFAANNQEYNRYTSSSNISERALREIYLKGFEICIKESNPKAVMTSYNLINGVHTNESEELIIDILRNEFDFDGIVVTDWIVGMSTLGNKSRYSGPTPYKVIKASGDIYMPGSKDDYNDILNAIKKKNLKMEELERSASRIYNFAKEIQD
ncbi:beta-glucosidase-related glycosidase [Piromyces finnis]|uniref:beta-glucosidase n=1 Tax=Piromyces finnis TaxID=1754191 RepID=A0A1Y1VCM4_9FUNG|nr:beta-glucosidase-related glycosidase [Piromyces finnis]|eukprot:ORX52626.1 beta-glucosidase-related glycosidase [Piromyces finnis]